MIHVYSNRAQQFLDEGNLDAAESELLKAAEIAPENFTVNFKLAQVYLRKGQADQSYTYCRRSLELMPNFVEGHILLGDIYYHRGKRDKALDEYLYAIRVGANAASAWLALGRYYFREALYSDAVGAFAKAAQVDPRNEEAKTQLELAERKKKSLTGMMSEQGAKAKMQLVQPFKRQPKPTKTTRKRT